MAKKGGTPKGFTTKGKGSGMPKHSKMSMGSSGMSGHTKGIKGC